MEWLSVLTSGMLVRHFNSHISSVILVVGPSVLHSSLTVSWVIWVLLWKDVLNVLSIVFLDVHCMLWDVVMAFTIAFK